MFRIKTKTGRLEISKDLVVVLIMDLFALAYKISARNLSFRSLMFPSFLLLGILAFSIMCIIQGVHFCKNKEEDASVEAAQAAGFGITPKLLAFVGLVLVALLAFQYLGSILSIALFLILSMLVLGVRNKLLLTLLPILMVLFVYLIFKVWLAVPLPMGVLKFLQ